MGKNSSESSVAEKRGTNLLQVRLNPKALQKLELLASVTGVKNKTHLVNVAINLSADILKIIHDGGSVIYEEADGTRSKVRVIML